MWYKMNVCLQSGRTDVLFRPALSGLSLLTAIIVGVLLRPWCSDLYHLRAGAQALRQALGTGDELEWWYFGPQTVQDEQALQQSIAHLVRVRSQPYSRRLLGRAYAAQGDLLNSIQVLEQFTSAHPQHPLGHLELAAAYMLAEERWQMMYRVDLLASLSEATLSAPDLVGNVRYVAEGWSSQYVYPTRFVLPPDEQPRPTLFLHSGSQVTFTLALTQPVVLRFGIGLDPRSLDWGGDGATFEVFVNGQRVFLEHLTIEMAREGWQEREVDLRAWSGQQIVLTLATTPGPRADNTADWAGWGEPKIEDPAAKEIAALFPAERMVSTWKTAGLTAQTFIACGESARKAKRYEEALEWYGRAARLEPHRGAPWYHAGLAWEGMERWEEALAAYERAVAVGSFAGVHRSSPYYRTGVIYQWRLEPRQADAALAAYEAAIEADDFSAHWEAADCHYKRGEILFWKGADLDECIREFQQAIELNPRHDWAHIRLGLAYYARDRDAVKAEAEIRQAIALSPRNKWAYYHLGEVYRQEGRVDEARAMYEKALEIDPEFEAAQERLESLTNRH